jgi:hypothetical protein
MNAISPLVHHYQQNLQVLYGMAVTPTTRDYEPMMVEVVLIEFASSALWGGHLRGLNFGSCEEFLSTEEGRRNALSWML